MSDDTSSGSSSSAEPMIPKSRLDELIQERNQERQERQFLQNQLGEIARQRQVVQRPEQDDPEMEELKQRDPAAYKRFKKQENELRQVRAGFSSLADQNDRLDYFSQTGSEGKKMLGQVEQVLKHEREVNRNFNVTRSGIYQFLKGQELIRQQQERGTQPQAKTPVMEESDGDVPSSDPKLATTIRGGTASSQSVEKSREERFKELENVEF